MLADGLMNGLILMHPFVSGELACGNLKNRAQVLSDLKTLPSAILASHEEVARLLEERQMCARGLGWVDLHLLASAMLSHCRFWTLDRRLALASEQIGLSR